MHVTHIVVVVVVVKVREEQTCRPAVHVDEAQRTPSTGFREHGKILWTNKRAAPVAASLPLGLYCYYFLSVKKKHCFFFLLRIAFGERIISLGEMSRDQNVAVFPDKPCIKS
jgi:hypothetical protein